MLGVQLGLARALGAIVDDESRGIGQTVISMASMIGILIFLNWAPSGGSVVWWDFVYRWSGRSSR